EQAQRIAHVGYWDRDLETDRVEWPSETYRILGLAPQACELTPATLWQLIHPEDRPSVAAAMAEVRAGGPRYEAEYRVLRPGGEVRTVHSHADMVNDGSGRRRRMFGIVHDITDRKRAEEELRKVRKDGTLILVRETARVMRRTGRDPVALIVCEDITERRRAEEALHGARAELAHVTRVTTLDQLASSIAHEVNQPLAAIVA